MSDAGQNRFVVNFDSCLRLWNKRWRLIFTILVALQKSACMGDGFRQKWSVKRPAVRAFPAVSVLCACQPIHETRHRIARFNWHDLQEAVWGIKNLDFHVLAPLQCFDGS